MVRWLLDPALGDQLPYPTFFVAVIFAAWIGGLRPALLATGLGFFIAWYCFTPPRSSLFGTSGPQFLGLSMYLIVSFGIAAFGEAMRVGQRRFEELIRQHEGNFTSSAFSGDAILVQHGLRDVAVVGFGLIVTLLLIGGSVGYHSAQKMDADRRMVAHTHEVIGALETLLSSLQDAETGQRGYLLAEDEKYLKPYEDALERVQLEFTRLTELTYDNVDQQARLAVLDKKIDVRLEELEQTVALMKKNDRPAALKIVRSDIGKSRMDDCRNDIAAMQRVEHELLKKRANESEASFRTTLLSILLPAIIGVVLAGVVLYLSQRSLRQRQRASLILAEQKERLRTTLASIGDGVISTDSTGNVTYLNAVAEQLTGWTNSDASGMPLTQVFHIVNESTRQPVENPAMRALKEGVVVGLANHTVLIAKDGTERPIDDSAAPIRCVRGELVGCVLVFRDITARHATERTMRESEERAAFVRRASGVGFWYCDLPFDTLQWDELVKTHFHLPPDANVTIDTFYARIHPDDREKTLRAIERSIEGRTGYDTEYRTVAPDTGAVRWVRAIGRTFYAADGSPTRFDGVTLDISEQKRVGERLRQSEERFRLAADAVNGIIYEFDIKTGHVERTRGLFEVLGYRADEVPPTAAWWSEQIHPDDLEPPENCAKELVGDFVMSEYRVRHKDGRWLHVVDRAVLLPGDEGQPVKMVGCTVDVTAQRQADDELRRRETFTSGVLGSITDGFFVIDEGWRLTFANEEIVRRFGKGRAQIIGAHLWEIFPAAVGNEAHVNLHRAMADRVAVEYEVFYPPWQLWFLDKAFPTNDGGLAVYSRDITERKQADDRLRQSEARLRRVFESNVVGMIRWDLDRSLIIDANAEFLRMTDYTRDDVTGGRLNFRDLTPPEWTARNEQGISAIRADGHAAPYEKEYFRKDGSRVPLIIAGTRFDDSPAEGMSFLIDISEAKRAEAQLRASELRLRLVVESATGYAIFTMNPDGIIDGWNAGAERLFGYSEAEVVGQHDRFLYTPDDAIQQIPEREMKKAAAEGRAVNERWHVRKGGARFWGSGLVQPLRTDRGVVGFLKIMRDMTEQREYEERLRQSEERLRLALDSADMGSWEWNIASGEIIWSARTRELFGVDAHRLITFDLFVSCLHPDDVEKNRRKADEALETGEYENEYRVVLPDGRVRWIASRGRVLRDGQQHSARMSGVMADTTARRQAEEDLKERTRQLNFALASTGVGLWLNTLPLGCLYWDDRTRELFSVPPGVEPTAELFWSRLHPDDREPTRLAMEAAIRDCTLYAIDHRVVNPDTGEVRWMRSSGRATYDAAGTPTRFDGINYDITQQKRQEQELADGQRMLFTLVEKCPFGIYIVDDEFRIVSVNAGSHDKAFASVRPLIGRPFDEAMRIIWPEPVATHCINIFRHTLATGEPYYSTDFVSPRSDTGQTEGYEWELHRVALPSGRQGVVCYYFDATRLRQVERELSLEVTTMNRLHELVVRLLGCPDLVTALNEVLDAAITLVGADMGSVQLLNPQSGMLEIVAHRGLGPEFLEHFRCVSRDERTACGRAMKNGERVVIEDVQADTEYVPHLHVARLENWHGVQSTPLMARSGELLGTLSTQYRRPHKPAERDLRILDLYARQATDFIERTRFVDALKDADCRKDEFLATLAHELRNPLAPIRNGLQLLRLAEGDGETIEQSRTMMERQLEQMVRLVDDLMDVSRISRGKLELRKERVQLSKVLNSAIETSRPLIDEMGHELTVTLPAHTIVVDADATRLAQVFLNLLNNAAKYSDRGSHIQLTAERQGGDVVVSVRDTGIGIAADQLPRVFEMFSQVDRSLEKSQGGLGIGLSLVKRLVELHGGRIEAKSEGVGKGSQFIMRLPVVVDASAPQKIDEKEEGDVKSTLRILIVDDNRDSADSLSMMLKIMGNETHTAYDGEAAVAAANAFRPAVILLDIGLPKLNGYDTCRRLREQTEGKELVIIAQTGWGQDEDRHRTHEAGFDHHLVKPVDPHALMKLLAELSNAEK